MTTPASPSSSPTMMTDRAPAIAARSRSSGSEGFPLRHTTRVVRRSGTAALIASSITLLSARARMTIEARFSLSLATASSLTMGATRGDQPRIIVWPDSSTRLRPSRSSSTFWSTPLARRPISEPPSRMPVTVTARPNTLVGHPWSSAAPGSTVRSTDCQNASTKLSPVHSLATVAMTATMMMMARKRRPRYPITTTGPRASALSSRYRSFARSDGRAAGPGFVGFAMVVMDGSLHPIARVIRTRTRRLERLWFDVRPSSSPPRSDTGHNVSPRHPGRAGRG